MEIPVAKLGIPLDYRDKVGPKAPRKARMAVAKGLLPIPPDVLLMLLYVLTDDENARIRESAHQTVMGLPETTLVGAVTRATHPKLLEYLAQHRRHDWELMIKVYSRATANDRTARIIAQSARDPQLIDAIVANHERMLITPAVFLDIQDNKRVSLAQVERARSFLRMQRSLPEGWRTEEEQKDWIEGTEVVAPEERTRAEQRLTIKVATGRRRKVHVTDLKTMNVEAECMAAILGLCSPWTNGDVAERLDLMVWEVEEGGVNPRFAFGFADEVDFGKKMVDEEVDLDREEVRSMAMKIAEMTVGKRIKLAYLGNTEARKLLLRDRNKTVAIAVVKSGRMSDSEAARASGNKNIPMEVLREISSNREFLRKYSVKVALVNNPKCPVSVAVSIVTQLHRGDLVALARNKNVSSVVSRLAKKINKQRTG